MNIIILIIGLLVLLLLSSCTRDSSVRVCNDACEDLYGVDGRLAYSSNDTINSYSYCVCNNGNGYFHYGSYMMEMDNVNYWVGEMNWWI